MTLSGLDGVVAVVTGAASGIGAAITDALRANGTRVAACDINPIGGADDEFRVDVTDRTAVETLIGRIDRDLGPIHILVNVAGILRPGRLLDTTDKDWSEMLAVNTTGVFHVTQAVARHMAPRGRGSIVTVSSNAGGVPRQGIGGYAASKAASTHLTRCFGLELAEYGIRCNVVAPGSTDTPMFRSLWGNDPDKAIIDAVAGSPAAFRLGIPLGKVAQPSDVAELVCFLSSDAASHLTMQELYVDGGAALK